MFWWFDPFTWLLFFFVLGIGVYLVIKYELVVTTKRGTQNKYIPETKESPLEILEKRFARGEITQVEFDRVKKKLEET
ncbi:MAG: SHOCT domain-containing protein [wastewater metagenome]|nr:SHOCT domain-containing protein [Candidatus Loosdrechtia aerotolerans]